MARRPELDANNRHARLFTPPSGSPVALINLPRFQDIYGRGAAMRQRALSRTSLSAAKLKIMAITFISAPLKM